MHPLHDYIARQLAERIKARSVVVWYDARREFAPFVEELRGDEVASSITVAAVQASLIEFTGSMFEVRADVEPLVAGEQPQPVVVYLPGVVRDPNGSVLMELEKAGDCYEPQLKKLARNLLRQRFTDGVIDDLLAPDAVAYEDLARAASDDGGAEGPSILKGIFHESPGADAMLAVWLASDGRDAELLAKEATGELAKLIRSRLGLELPVEEPLGKLRSITARYVLAGEFRGDLASTPPASLAGVAAPRTKSELQSLRDLAQRLRVSHADAYSVLADRVETELGLVTAVIPGDSLGSTDTFRFEERVVRSHCEQLIAAGRYVDALALIAQRDRSFWVDRDVSRRAQWEACRLLAEVGQLAVEVKAAVAAMHGTSAAWIDRYTAPDGWYRLDQAQRRLEGYIASLDDEPDARPLGLVRRAYEDACQLMSQRFVDAFSKGGWTAPGVLQQTHVYSSVVSDQPKPVAYLLVDAMRFEMGVALSERLPASADVRVRPAVAALPTITPVGMGALMPGASTSFDVVDENGKLGVRVDGSFLPDLATRRTFASSHVPGLVDLTLGELLSLSAAKLEARVRGAQVVIVRSQEIDLAGESGFAYQARQIMDTVIENLARVIRKLAGVGVQHAVVSADHGHLFSHADRDEAMRIEAPGGATVDLHRRCWIGRGGATPSGCTRVAASALGYASDLDLVFPSGLGVFKAGGDLGYHHGGPTLQELIVPVVTVRSVSAAPGPKAEPVSVTGVPAAITNRIFSAVLQLGGANLELFSQPTVVLPMLLSAGAQVGKAGMAIGADFDLAAGTVRLQPGAQATIGFMLGDDAVESVRIVVLDPVTDAELYRSPSDIPVHLGVG
jgi:hypothetical protein